MAAVSGVRIWEENCTIPTYPVYPAEKSPLFIEKRAYQGSTGKVYPLPVTEKISDEKEDVEYRAVYLENEYLKICVLPQLGGRIQRAYDKTNGYDFVYYNHVIKPALVGLTGPWISGGIEFNWPQHHRPSTYAPVEYSLCENADGSATVHVSEIDKMYGTKGMASITLYPDKAYIEIKGRLYNQTDLPQTFLWWANPAVPVNDNTYSVFPPDVNAVMDHGKRAVSTFPIATGEYYKWDYSAGVDISRYKNVKVPTSYMAAHSDYDFVGNYDEGAQAGLLHVADHHICPGKKQWTWGNGDFGRTWDRNLTDSDGPYIELMTGVFCDNQPDFTWLAPHEEKTFVQYFMPYKGVGRVGNATKDALVGLSDGGDGKLVLKIYATGTYCDATIRVQKEGRTVYEGQADLAPEACHCVSFALPEGAPLGTEGCKVQVSCQGKTLVAYAVYERKPEPLPRPADAMKAPKELKSTEELYLAATHLEQYRHATYEPEDYYLEGLRRDGTDIRLNIGYGLLLYRRGRIRESIPHFEAAVAKQTWKNPNPASGEGYFNMGLALEADGQEEKAYDAFFKSTWCADTRSAGFFHLARLETQKGEYGRALEFVESALAGNWHDMKARTLKAALMRKLGLDSVSWLEESLTIDPLCMGCLYERASWEERKAGRDCLSGNAKETDKLGASEAPDGPMGCWKEKMRPEAHNYLVLSLDYGKAGLYEEALEILEACPEPNPMCFYYIGCLNQRMGKEAEAAEAFRKGEAAPFEYCFPNRVEEIAVLTTAIDILDAAPMAHYYLGNLLYDKKQYQTAMRHWEAAVREKKDLAVAWRNLAIAYYNKEGRGEKALEAMEKACLLDASYPRYRLEHDQLAARMNLPVARRLEAMESAIGLVRERDDLYLRYITLLNCSGRYREALEALSNRRFHPWEGGEGKVSAQYRYALVQTAVLRMREGKAQEALSALESALAYPENLGEGKLPNVPDNQIHYLLGKAALMLGKTERAEAYFHLAAQGPQEPAAVLYYNDQPSDFIFYQGLACRELGWEERAKKAFHQLQTFGERHLFDEVGYDYFAVSLPEIDVFQEDIGLRNELYCNYLRALGALGLGDTGKAERLLTQILERQADYQGAIAHLYTERIG